MRIWTTLGIEPTAQEREIKRAYARKLKTTRPEDDPDGFQALHEAYQAALHRARMQADEAQEQAQEEDDAQVTLAPAAQASATEAPAPSYAPAYSATPAARPMLEPQPQPMLQPLPERQPAGPAPMDEARRVWAEFVRGAAVQPRTRLAKFMARDDMLNLQVRECFELCAVHACADEACPDELREAVADFYRWETDCSFVARRLPDDTELALAHLRAQRSHAHFWNIAKEHKAVRALLADDAGRAFGSTRWSSFTKEMRRLTQAIRMHHPDLLRLRLNHDVFETWERRVEGRRYFLDTALLSFFLGYLLCVAAPLALARLGVTGVDLGALYIGCEVLAFVLVGLFVLCKPAAFAGYRLDAVRSLPLWQFGWIPLYAVASAAMYVPHPPSWFVIADDVLLLACVGLACFAFSAAMAENAFGFICIAIAAFGMGVPIGKEFLPEHGPIITGIGAVGAVLLFFRSGHDLCSWLEVPVTRFLPLRAAWLAGSASLILLGGLTRPPVHLYLAGTWIWLLAGMLLSRPSINLAYGLLGALGAAALTSGLLPPPLPRGTPHAFLEFALYAVAIFMIVNQVRTKQYQNPFA
jgi:hypothetical protein